MDEELLGAYDTSSVSLRLPPSPTGEGFLVCPTVYLFFLTSTAFVSKNTKYGIPLSRYTVFLQNSPLGYDPKGSLFWVFMQM